MWFKRQASQAVATMALGLSSFVFGAGSVVHVDDNAPPGGDGASWDTAYRFLQDGLTSAAKGGVTEIRVGQGTYKPDRDEANPDGTGVRQASFQLLNGVALLGGYAGIGAKDPDARDVEMYETLLSGDLLGNDGPDFLNNGDNSYHVAFATGTDDTAVLDGFTITAGNASVETGPNGRGGGLYILAASPTIVQCTFLANRSEDFGGGCCSEASSPSFESCSFISNFTLGELGSSDEGGAGLCIIYGSSSTVTSCSFVGNAIVPPNIAARVRGGGVLVEFESSLIMIGCSFEQNEAKSGGGLSVRRDSCAQVVDCSFVQNSASGGGAISNAFGVDLTVENCLFLENSSGGGGGAIRTAFDKSITILNSTFESNTASQRGGAIEQVATSWMLVVGCDFSSNSTRDGGAVHGGNLTFFTMVACEFNGNQATLGDGGAIRGWSGRAVNCLFRNNTAVADGGAIHQQGLLEVVNCVLTGNDAGGQGGAIHVHHADSRLELANCVIYNNTATTTGGVYNQSSHEVASVANSVLWNNLDAGRNTELAQIGSAGAPWALNYSCVEGLSGDLGGMGNIDADPLFVDPENGNLQLSPGSPCIDAGHNWYVPVDEFDYDEDGVLCELLPVDLDGNPRFNADEDDFDPGCGVPVVVDMGAYEYQFDPADQVTFADLDGDDAVSATDLLGLLVSWGPCAKGCCLADLDLDGNVGASDLLAMLANWGACP